MRKIALKLLFNWLPSATATFVGGLALHLYLQPPTAPPASAKTEFVPAAAAIVVAPPITVARPTDAVPEAVPDSARASAPAAAKATTVQPKPKSAPPRAPVATATRNHPPAAVAPDPTPRENAKAAVAPRLPPPETIVAATPPGTAPPAVEEPAPPQGPIAPQPFSMAEFKQRLAGATVETPPSEPTCDDRLAPLTAKPCATKPWP